LGCGLPENTSIFAAQNTVFSRKMPISEKLFSPDRSESRAYALRGLFVKM